MQKTYTKNYFKIYFWQGISVVLNFLSMFIVVPYLTANPNIFGIYAICTSLSIYLAYADLGFMGAGQKYAAEYFVKKERSEEMKVIGFVIFILAVFLAAFSAIFLLLSIKPDLLVRNLNVGTERIIASSLFLILALFTPTTLLQRLMQTIYGIRLEEYIIQRLNVIGNILKIFSVLWFFRNEQYNIVGYFLFLQIVNFTTACIALFIAHKRFAYDFKELLQYIRFNKDVFVKTKKLAFNSLYLILAWILYYELDPTVIGKFLGPKQVALYAIGLTMLSFYRSIFSILFSPFNARFNHFIGLNDALGLKKIYLQVISFSTPVVVFPIITVVLLAKPLILTWVGNTYSESIIIAQLLILCNIFAFIAYPTSILLMAQERVREMYLVSTIITLSYWGGIIITWKYWGLNAFAIFKLVAFALSAFTYYFIMIRYMKIDIINSFNLIIRPIILPTTLLITTIYLTYDYLPVVQSRLNFFIVLSVAGLAIIIAGLIFLLTSPDLKSKVVQVWKAQMPFRN
jgi:O-antigen/teichoic acid export membrane protein